MSRTDMNSLPLPLTVAGVTTEWVQAALRFEHPDVVLRAATASEVKHGSATKVWLRLEYADGTGDGLPPTLVLKAGFDEKMLALAGEVFARETLFFQQAAPQLEIPLPRCYFAGTDPANGQSALLLEDLVARGCSFGHIAHPLGVDRVAEALELLAVLHGRYWERQRDPALRGFVRTGGHAVVDWLLGEENWQRCMQAPRARVVPPALRDRERVAGAIVALRRHDALGPRCLLHGDAHLGNMYFEPDGAPRLLDWQAAVFGSWDQDVSYLVTCTLDTDDRRRSERDLLRHYLERLRASGVSDVPGFDQAWLSHRRQQAYGLMGLLCTPEMQTEEFTELMGGRFIRAVEDHETLELLGF